jgi:hypothetical protein
MANVKRVDGVVDAAIAAGAKVVVRGGQFKEGPLGKGAFYRPTLLEISDHSMAIAQDEVFGPVLVMQAFDAEAEAVALANNSEYGLAASGRAVPQGSGAAKRLWGFGRGTEAALESLTRSWPQSLCEGYTNGVHEHRSLCCYADRQD